MKIAIGSLSIGEKYKNDTKYGRLTKINYCKKWGYDFIEDSSNTDKSRPLQWSKIKLILKYLSDYDYFVWIDADTLIMNQEISIESFIVRLMVPENKELIYSKEYSWVNTGVMFIKNTDFMNNFFKESWRHPNLICLDQGAIDMLWRTNWRLCQSKINIVEQTEFNSGWYNWEWGQFLIHFPGCGESGRKPNSLRRMMEMFCPLKMSEEVDEEYQKRLLWLHRDTLKERELMRHSKYLPL